MLRVFVISPLPAVRAGLRALISADEECQVVGEADQLDRASGQLMQSRADVAILDADPNLDLGDIPPMEGAQNGLGLVLLGPFEHDEQLAAELVGHPWAYLPRITGGEQLLAAIRAVANRLVVIDPAIGQHLLARGSMVAGGHSSESGEELTEREREVLQLVALGLPNKSVAVRLKISEHTVKFHVAAILGKLGAGSRTEAVHLGARRGLVAL